MRTWLCTMLLIFSVVAFFLADADNPDWLYVSALTAIVNVCICLDPCFRNGGTDV